VSERFSGMCLRIPSDNEADNKKTGHSDQNGNRYQSEGEKRKAAHRREDIKSARD